MRACNVRAVHTWPMHIKGIRPEITCVWWCCIQLGCCGHVGTRLSHQLREPCRLLTLRSQTALQCSPASGSPKPFVPYEIIFGVCSTAHVLLRALLRSLSQLRPRRLERSHGGT